MRKVQYNAKVSFTNDENTYFYTSVDDKYNLPMVQGTEPNISLHILDIENSYLNYHPEYISVCVATFDKLDGGYSLTELSKKEGTDTKDWEWVTGIEFMGVTTEGYVLIHSSKVTKSYGNNAIILKISDPTTNVVTYSTPLNYYVNKNPMFYLS